MPMMSSPDVHRARPDPRGEVRGGGPWCSPPPQVVPAATRKGPLLMVLMVSQRYEKTPCSLWAYEFLLVLPFKPSPLSPNPWVLCGCFLSAGRIDLRRFQDLLPPILSPQTLRKSKILPNARPGKPRAGIRTRRHSEETWLGWLGWFGWFFSNTMFLDIHFTICLMVCATERSVGAEVAEVAEISIFQQTLGGQSGDSPQPMSTCRNQSQWL